MWHLKTTTPSVVIVTLVMVAKTAPNYDSQIPGAPSLTELQKITLMGTAAYPAKGTIDAIKLYQVIYILYIYIYIHEYIYVNIYIYICR